MSAQDVVDRAAAAADGIRAGLNGASAHADGEGTQAKHESPWPTLDPAALHGLAGDVVRAIEPHTEGDPVAILLNYLTMYGSAVGPSPYAPVGATKHKATLFVVHVGETSRSRKGTSHNEAERVVRLAEPAWASRVMGGLSSGEGLIFAVRDPVQKIDKKGELILVDPGVEDKRLLVVEPEYSLVLRVASRDGNTLSELLRCAWDGRDLRTLTKNSPLVATHPHIAVSGHITKDELRRELTETAQLNGYANRHLFICVRRSKLLPHGGSLSDRDVMPLVHRTHNALNHARHCTEIRRDDEANAMWESVYPYLTADQPGMLGAIVARAEAQVLRLSLLYALLDQSRSIRQPHLEAALAVWQYAEDSARFIFGDATGDPVADRILSALRTNSHMSQNEIVDLFERHVSAPKLSQALESLVAAGKIRSTRLETGGRPATIWQAAS